MQNPRFPLEKVQRVRQNVREQRRLELLDAQHAEDQAVAQIAGLQAELHTLQSQTRSVIRPGQLDLIQLRHMRKYEQSLRQELEMAQNRRQRLAAEVEKRRQDLVEADREVKVLDRLQERQQVQYRIDQARREARTRDDQTVMTVAAAIDS
jgi:flagellar FliJ protein